MSLSAHTSYVKVNDALRPAVIVNRHRSAIAVPIDLAYLFAGKSVEDDHTALHKAMQYAAILFDGAFIKGDVIRILDLICSYMSAALKMPPAPKEMEEDFTKLVERSGVVININGDDVVNYAN